jgi:hypothetical protein
MCHEDRSSTAKQARPVGRPRLGLLRTALVAILTLTLASPSMAQSDPFSSQRLIVSVKRILDEYGQRSYGRYDSDSAVVQAIAEEYR